MYNNENAPRIYAWELLELLNIKNVPVNPLEICKIFNIDIEYKDINLEGVLIVKNASKKILLNKNIQYETRRRFTISHEIGHYLLPGHENVYRCTNENIAKYNCYDEKEKEANIFAAELLMPDKYFKKDVNEKSLILDDLISLAEKYQTSLTSTAIKFIKNTKDSGAIILSKNNNIIWSFKSDYFPYELHEDDQISELSNAYDFFSFENNVGKTLQTVPYYSWIKESDCGDMNLTLKEQSLGFNNLDLVFTVIYIE